MAENATGRAETVEQSTNVPFDEQEDSIDLVALIATLLGGKRTILRATLVCAALATLIAFLLPPIFTSKVAFIPPNLTTPNSMASVLAGQISAMGAGDLGGALKTPGDLYSGILQSQSIAAQIVKQFDLIHLYKVKKESQAEKALASNTKVVVDPKSTIVTLSVSDKSPGRAQAMANAYMDALRATNGRLALSQASQRRLFFGDQLAKEKDDLEDAEVELKKTEEASGLIAPSGQTESEIRTLAETQAQIAAREVQLAALRDAATEQNPEVIRLHSELDDLHGQLARLQQGKGAGSIAGIPTSKVPGLELDYVRKEREVKYHEALFDMLSRQYEAARLDESREAPVLQVLDSASFPDTKSSPKRSLYMLGGILLGFMAGCVWVLVRRPLQAFRERLARGETA